LEKNWKPVRTKKARKLKGRGLVYPFVEQLVRKPEGLRNGRVHRGEEKKWGNASLGNSKKKGKKRKSVQKKECARSTLRGNDSEKTEEGCAESSSETAF